jgi:hypothetical protein
MTAAELIAKLQTLPPETVLELNIGDPNDSAYTDDFDLDGTVLRGWVSSDNEDHFAPWADREEGW